MILAFNDLIKIPVIISLSIFLLSFCLLSLLLMSIRFKRSFRASVVERYIRHTSKRKKHAKHPNKFKKYLKRHKDRGDNFIFPNIKLDSKVVRRDEFNIPIFYLSKSDNPKANILFLHGGAYISQPLKYHWKFCDYLVNKLDVNIMFPIYPLTPNHHWDEAFDLVQNLYSNLKESDLPLILIGDSSGGGLALSCCEHLSLNNLKQPDALILLSPWLDISMSNPLIKKYEKKDPMLAVEPVKEIANLWANGLDMKDYKVSPFFGDVTNLTNITMFVGTRELLYPEITDFYKKLIDKNIECELIIGRGMNHDYPLFPIPEAKKAKNYICKKISETINNKVIQK